MNKYFIKILLHISYMSVSIYANNLDNIYSKPQNYSLIVIDSIKDLQRQKAILVNFLKKNQHLIKLTKKQKIERMVHNLTRRINLLHDQLKDEKVLKK